MTLNELSTGESALIARVRGRGAFRKRLTEMGFVRGKPVLVVKSAPLQDPVEYRILDSNVSLRRSEAGLVEVIQPDGDGVSGQDQLPDEDRAQMHRNGEEKLWGRQWRRATRKAIHGWEDSDQNNEDLPWSKDLQKAGRTINVALVGNPNCGKTSIFNRLSRSNEHVGNYAGVTVDSKLAELSFKGYHFRITDLPGTYSLSDYSPEERYVREHIMKEKPDVVVNVVDANNLERNLYLTSQLIDMDISVVLALNMYDDLLGKKDVLDIDLLSKLLGSRVVPTIGNRGKGVFRLLNHVIAVFEELDPDIRHIHINYGEEVEASVRRIQELIRDNPSITDHYSSRFLSLKLLEGDDNILHTLSSAQNFEEIRGSSQDERHRLSVLFRDEPVTLITDARYGFIAGALKETMKKSGNDPGFSRSRRIDRVLTHKYLGLPIFLAFLWLMFTATFRLGNYPMDWIESGVELLSVLLRNHMAEGFFRDLLIDGVIGGVGGVIVFLPNILILFFFISLMEDTGYMARTAFIMDRVMHLFGLHGKSFIPLIMGFGCNVPAMMATRTLEDRNDRILTMLIIPFMSCSARLPVYVLVAGAIFPEHAGTVIFGLYMLGILTSLLVSIIFKKTLFRNQEAPFVMELPVYRNPGLKVVLRHMWQKGEHYLKKMGGVILLASVVIWALGYFPRNIEWSKDYEGLIALEQEKPEPSQEVIDQLYSEKELERETASLIGRMGTAIEPLIRPLGFDWKMGISLVTGFAAKEVVVSTMGVLYQADENPEAGSSSLQKRLSEQVYGSGPKAGTPVFTPLVGLSFLIFILFYLPCVAVIVAVGREAGSWKWAGFVLLYTTVIAWVASFIVYQLGSILQLG
ncbi:MAG: ferrous iron transport protein B [Bacteroidetes bacterium]|nr:MAG: ferrous iron transport protein B [Bacteroidota bacterium]